MSYNEFFKTDPKLEISASTPYVPQIAVIELALKTADSADLAWQILLEHILGAVYIMYCALLIAFSLKTAGPPNLHNPLFGMLMQLAKYGT